MITQAGEQTIVFNPTVLSESATQMDTLRRRFQDCIERIDFLAVHVMTWSGESAEVYREKMAVLHQRSQTCVQKWQIMIRSLEAAANIQRITENTAIQQAESLPTNGVFLC